MLFRAAPSYIQNKAQSVLENYLGEQFRQKIYFIVNILMRANDFSALNYLLSSSECFSFK